MAYAVVIVLAIVQWQWQLRNNSLLSLSNYILFFLTVLTLTKSKARYGLSGGLLLCVFIATLALDKYASTLTGSMQTAMLAMQLMTAVTMIQNILLGLYLLVCAGLLWREPKLTVRCLGGGIAAYFAVQLLPQAWFTLRFIFSLMN